MYSTTKLTASQRSSVQNCLTECVFTCGSDLQDADLSLEDGITVYTRPLTCSEPVKKQYYSAGYSPICVYCATSVCTSSTSSSNFPQCEDCSEREPIPR